ncbi:MAG: GHKL domain-containing protein, partial [Nanoarchaeota archaeon]|nr:GHKL domain-containing protein [Nanoarchaeota archaeon]
VISLLLTLSFVYVFLINYNLSTPDQIPLNLTSTFVLFTLLITIFFVFMIAYLVYKIIISDQLQHQNILTKQQLEYQLNHYEQLERSIKETRQIKHDMHHHLTCLKKLISANQYTQSELYIENIETSLNSVKKHLETGNIIVDAIIHEKLHKIDELQITFKFEGSLPSHDFIRLMDLCAIIANSLDNAIEACGNLSEEHHRFILIETSVENHCWKYKIKNSSKEIEVCSSLLSTSKKDKVNHGFGLLNVKEAVARYNGDFEYRYDEGDFILETKILLI